MFRNSHKIFVDTSAFYALIDRSDRNHSIASTLWPDLLNDTTRLLTSDYVVLDTVGLLQKRIGFEAASRWYEDILGVIEVLWVDVRTHQQAYLLWLNLEHKQISLVDCASFVIMQQYEIDKAFCFKPHFKNYNLTLTDPSFEKGIKQTGTRFK